jgi:hypothetical protein
VQNKKYARADCKNKFLFFSTNKFIAAASFVLQQVEIVFIEVANAKELVSSFRPAIERRIACRRKHV